MKHVKGMIKRKVIGWNWDCADYGAWQEQEFIRLTDYLPVNIMLSVAPETDESDDMINAEYANIAELVMNACNAANINYYELPETLNITPELD